MRASLLAAVSCLPLFACATDPEPLDTDEPLDWTEADKADTTGAYRHYLLAADPDTEGERTIWMSRAGGGTLRCPDDVVRERCEVTAYDFLPTLALRENPEAVFAELLDRAMIARGRLVRTDDGRVYLRASTLTRGLTSVAPWGACYRLRARTTEGNCPDDGSACVAYDLEQLDKTVVESPQVLFFDDVDPTPDFWGQPTPEVQALIDEALAVARTNAVYACGSVDRRDTGDLFWANQVFAP